MIPDPENTHLCHVTRRHFFGECRVGLGAIALASLLAEGRLAGRARAEPRRDPMAPRPPHHRPRARAVVYLFMAGGPSQLELFDEKPKLRELDGKPTPESLMAEKRFAFLKKGVKLLGTRRAFRRHGACGAHLSELIPHIGSVADDICIVRSLRTDVFNHGPAKLFVNTGSPQFGRPSLGSWVTYGIGSEASDLPGFVVLQSGPRGPRGGAPLWGSGFLPTTYQGVPFRSHGDPVLNLSSPPGITLERQRRFFDAVRDVNAIRRAGAGDPEIATRIAAYEMAYRMQSSAPELMDLGGESPRTLAEYGAEPGKASFANNCLLARRLVERGVRFVQLYHTEWDHHGGPNQDLGKDLDAVTAEIDRPCAALVRDLKRRGLLDGTLVIWGGEFGRTPMGEPRETTGRDHHVDAYAMWFAGGGVRPGVTIGETDELGFAAIEDPVHIHDIQATVLHLLGLDHERLTYRFQGRDFRLTDVYGRVVEKMLA
jgi:hypothetical protein